MRLFISIITLFLLNVEAKTSLSKNLSSSSRALDGHTCGTHLHDGYELTSVSEIGPSMAGQNVVVISKISISESAGCTIMFCDESDPCCNSCVSSLLMGDIILESSENGPEIGCYGNDCDWWLGCTYNEEDVAVVHGNVSSDGNSIIVHDSCLLGTPSGVQDSCGAQRSGYTETTFEAINADMNGQKVMLSYYIENAEMAACTIMFCPDDNSCCNSCSNSPSFDSVTLISSGENEIGCVGTECDYEGNCVYNSGDTVTVYGMVDSSTTGSVSIIVDDHCIKFFNQ